MEGTGNQGSRCPGMICRIERTYFGYLGISDAGLRHISAHRYLGFIKKRCDSKKVMKKVQLTELWFGKISSKTDLGIVQNCVPPNLHGFIMFI